MKHNKPRTVFDTNGFAKNSGWEVIYTSSPDGEYIGKKDHFFSIGGSLPSLGYFDAPPEKEEGYAIVRSVDGWEYTEDHRGEDVYRKDTGEKIEIKTLGPVSKNLTPIPRPDSLHLWDEKTDKWVLSEEKVAESAKAKQSELIVIAEQQIKDLEEATDPALWDEDEIDPSDKEALKAWRRYLVKLKKAQPDNLPEPPEAI